MNISSDVVSRVEQSTTLELVLRTTTLIRSTGPSNQCKHGDLAAANCKTRSGEPVERKRSMHVSIARKKFCTICHHRLACPAGPRAAGWMGQDPQRVRESFAAIAAGNLQSQNLTQPENLQLARISDSASSDSRLSSLEQRQLLSASSSPLHFFFLESLACAIESGVYLAFG